MSYSKRQYVLAAFEELGLASYVFDLQPNDLESALRRLDSMMAEWNNRGLRLSYPIPGSPEFSDIDAVTNVPDLANDAIITNLALKIAPSFGKAVSNETKISAKMSMNSMYIKFAQPIEQQLAPIVPLGAGSKSWSTITDPFVVLGQPSVDVGTDGTLTF